MSARKLVAQRLVLAATGVFVAALAASCGSKLEEKECNALRSQAFDILNEAHHCTTDSDCYWSTWPGCERAASNKNLERIQALQDQFKGGQCEEPSAECREPPESYCKQGLCTFREEGKEQDLTPPTGTDMATP